MACRVIGALLVFAAFLLPYQSVAAESGPSNTVGFWKFDVAPGFTQVSFPLLPNDKTLDNVLGDQLTGSATPEESDQILRWDAAAGEFQMAWYNTASDRWEGDFSALSETEGYWIYVQPDHPATQTIVAYGGVVEEPYYNMGTIGPGYNAIGSVWAVPASIAQSGLNGFEGGLYLFLSDLIMTYDPVTGSYSYTWMDDGGSWQGDLTEFEPLKGYWIYIAPGHAGFEWSAYPHPNPATLDAQTPPPDYRAAQSTNPWKKKGLAQPPVPTPDIMGKVKKLPVSSTSAKGGVK